jgi:CheY-like chemotaxis protein
MLQPHYEVPAYIPALFSNPDDDARDDAREPARAPKPPVGSDAPTILVVDDDLANLALAEAILEDEGFRVCVAADGPSMFALLKTCTPALILMDIQLPETDGWELTRRLKADPATTHIPVIAITAYGKAGDTNKAARQGFAEFLSKPVSTRELPEIIRRHLATR